MTGFEECQSALGEGHAWIQLETHSEVTQTWQKRCLLWELSASSYAQCDVGYCRAHTLPQRQYQENFCLKECHISPPPWKSPWAIPDSWRRCNILSGAHREKLLPYEGKIPVLDPQAWRVCYCLCLHASAEPGMCPVSGSWIGMDAPRSSH